MSSDLSAVGGNAKPDAATQRDIRAAISAGRHPRGPAGDSDDLARLVQSAARPGLRQRMTAYRDAQRR